MLRVPILFGEVESLEESAVTILFQNLQDTSKEHVLSHYEIRYPTYTGDVARIIAQLLLKRKEVNQLYGSGWSAQMLHVYGTVNIRCPHTSRGFQYSNL